MRSRRVSIENDVRWFVSRPNNIDDVIGSRGLEQKPLHVHCNLVGTWD